MHIRKTSMYQDHFRPKISIFKKIKYFYNDHDVLILIILFMVIWIIGAVKGWL